MRLQGLAWMALLMMVGAGAHVVSARSPKVVVIEEGSAARHVALTPGEILEIRLAENATTGYQWTWHAPEILRQKETEEAGSDAKGPPGRGRTRRIQFEAVAPGRAELLMEYRRPWEKADVAPARVLRLDVEVAAAAGR